MTKTKSLPNAEQSAFQYVFDVFYRVEGGKDASGEFGGRTTDPKPVLAFAQKMFPNLKFVRAVLSRKANELRKGETPYSPGIKRVAPGRAASTIIPDDMFGGLL